MTSFGQYLNWTAKKAYIHGLVCTRNALKRRKMTGIKRKEKKQFHDSHFGTEIGSVTVCKSFFLSTLNIGKD